MKTILISAFSLAFATLSFAEVDFKKDVLPVLEKHCMKCHRAAYEDPRSKRTKKPKSGYRMDSAEFMKGEGSENDVNITAGDLEKSPAYKMMLLPEDDDYAMPPKGDRVPKEDIAKIGEWIKAGAKFGDWKETKFTAAGEKVEE